MKTRHDLILATLALLQADNGAGQNPAPEDVQVVDDVIDGIIEGLNDRNIYWSNDPENYEDKHIDPLSAILANAVSPRFGQARNPTSQASAEQMLRQMKPSSYVRGSVLPVDYF